MSKHERGQDDEVESPPQKKVRFDADPTVEEESEDFNTAYTSSEQEEEQVVEEPQETQDQTGEESSEKCYQNEKMEQYKGMLAALNQRVADVQTNFMNEMTILVNTFLTDMNDRKDARTTRIEESMADVEGLYVANVDTAAQLARTKDLTQKLYTDIAN